MDIVKLEGAINLYLKSEIGKFKSELGKHSGFAMDHSDLSQMIDSVKVEFREDPYYSNKIVSASDINIDGDGLYRFNGIGNMTVTVNLNSHIESSPVPSHMFAEVIISNIHRYLKFFGITTHTAFFNNDVKFLYMDYEVDEVDVDSYDNYNWDSVYNGTNKYWTEVDDINEQMEKYDTSIEGRRLIIHPDGTVSIANNKGRMVRVRLTTRLLGDINVKTVTKRNNTYFITGQAGRTEPVPVEFAKTLISFVDTGSPDIIKSGSIMVPDIKLKKV